MSHKLRLTLLVSAVVGLVLAATFTSVVVAYVRLEERTTDAQIGEILADYRAEVQKRSPEEAMQEVIRGRRAAAIGFFDKEGRKLGQAGPFAVPHAVGRGTLESRGEEYVGVRYLSEDFAEGRIVVAVNRKVAREQAQGLTLLLALVWIPLTLLGGAVGWVTVSRTFQPLIDMTTEAGRLSGAPGQARLAVPDDPEFGQLARALNAFLERIEHGVVAHERFIGDAAHELRTPLTILRGKLETALLRPRRTEEYEALLRQLLAESRRLSDLVETLLMSHQSPVMEAEPFDGAPVVSAALDRWWSLYRDKGVELAADVESAALLALPLELDRVADNLLSNALRHAPAGSTVGLRFGPDGDWARLTVSDEGPGVPEGLEERVFDRFYRTDPGRSRELGGFGIGLAMCKRLVEGRGGQIRAVRNEGKGTTFHAAWPTQGG